MGETCRQLLECSQP